MRNALKTFPWFEVILIVGLAIALINKPQTNVMSATPESTSARTTAATATAATTTTTQQR